ncbi:MULTISPECIES: hypothetical protein [unclassified Pseudomonas]|uniref:hypothetical protein n=1 Tax=unclassified Pseudomonas TaxID=196821 RepID=UPI00131BC209|nr:MULTISPECIES: hypothetical protein [unclassified Pseudomonas]
MRISFDPIRYQATLEVLKAGDVLTINGETFDFSVIPEGALLPSSAVACEFVRGNITRVDGELSLTLLLPYDVTSPNHRFDPAPLDSPPDGLLALPEPEYLPDEEVTDEQH